MGCCLDLASPTRERILAAFTAACLQTRLASRQEKRVIIILLIMIIIILIMVLIMPDNYFIPMQAKQAEAVSPRLRATLVRIVAGPLARFRASLTARQNKWLQQLAKEMGIRLFYSSFL